MKKLLTTFLFSLCMTLPAWSANISYTGLVFFQDKAGLGEDIRDANVYCSESQNIGAYPKSDNSVSIECPEGEGILIRYVGFEDITFTAQQLQQQNNYFEATLIEEAQQIKAVGPTNCTANISKGASKQHWDDELQKCIPDECYEPAYTLDTKNESEPKCEFANANCINSLDNQKGVQSAIWELNEDGESICEIHDCKKPYYDLVEDDSGMGEAYCFDTREINKNCLDTLSNKTGVKSAEWEDNDAKDDKICKIKSCVTPQYELKDGLCADKTGDDCSDTNNNLGEYGMFNGAFTCILSECSDFSQSVDKKRNTCKSYIGEKCTPTHNDNVKSAIWEDHSGMPMCVIKECKSKYRPNKAGDKCELIPKDCSDTDKKAVLAIDGVAEAGLDTAEKCVPTDCKCGYNLNNNKCVKWTDEPCDKMPTGAAKAIKSCNANDKPYCEIKTCDEDNYTSIKEGDKIIKCDSKRGEDCKSTLSAEQQKSVKVAEYKKNGNKMDCIVKECISKDYIIRSNQCVYNTDGDCTNKISHAASAKYADDNGSLVCKVIDCKDGYKENEDKTKCIKILKKCASQDDKNLKDSGHALETGIKENTLPEVCVPTECECGYDLQNDKCVALAADRPCDAKNSLPDGAKSGVLACKNKRKEYCQITACNDGYDHDKSKNTCDEQDAKKRCEKAGGTWDASAKKCNGATKCPKGKEWNDKLNKCFDEVIKKRSDEEIAELEKNAQAMKDKEQSTANKLLGGASMAATGIGGMMLAQSMAEQKADQEAEMDMRAYLETFVCKYADGKSFKGGTENIELPGGNDLLPLYTEYVNLANDLKVRKEALGMRPGIEAEKILDNATSGLYDDVALGKTGGAYASLARALQDPEGEDAKMWAEQKDKTKKNLIAGASVAGIGAVGGIVGNAIINKDAPKENSDKIKADFKGAQKELDGVKDPATPQKKCDDYKNIKGGTYPSCTCQKDNERFFSDDEDGCVACPTGQHYENASSKQCVPDASTSKQTTQACEISSTDILKNTTKDCDCVDNAHLDTETKKCTCNDKYHNPNNQNTCTEKDETIQTTEATIQESIKVITKDLSADKYFDTGKADLTADAKKTLQSIALVLGNSLKLGTDDIDTTTIIISGHTDKRPYTKNKKMDNKKLSQMRANAVKTEMIASAPALEKHIKTVGYGSDKCDKEGDVEACRKVTIEVHVKDAYAASVRVLTEQFENAKNGKSAFNITQDTNSNPLTNVLGSGAQLFNNGQIGNITSMFKK